MKVTINEKETYSFSLRDACREEVRPRSGQEAGLGHAGGRATHGAVAEKARMRGFKYRQLSVLIPSL
jgi:hypothetical protein